MQFLVIFALAVACVVGHGLPDPMTQEYQGLPEQQGPQEQARDKRTLLLQTYPTTLLNNPLYRDVIPSTYASYYPYTYPYTYIPNYIPNYYPYLYLKK